MRTSLRRLIVPAFVLASACGGEKSPSAAISDDLRSDLDLAASTLSYPELSKIAPEEQSQLSAPKRASAPKRQPTRRPAAVAEVTPPEPTTEVMEDVAAAPEAAPETVQPAAAPEPVIASPRPTPVPVTYPADNGRMGGGGPMVVIRGGSAGEDHCEIHDRRGRPRVGILINSRMPPMGVPTFPSSSIPINPISRLAGMPRIR